MLRAIFLDAAGTLIHVREPVGRTYAAFARRCGVEVDEAALDKGFRSAWRQTSMPLHPPGSASPDDDRAWWRALVAASFAHALNWPLAEAKLDAFFPAVYDHFSRGEAWQVFPDVVPALEELRRDHCLLVVSNFDTRLRKILAAHELLPFFDSVILSSEVGAPKPHARLFAAAVQAAACAPHECLHAGDDAELDVRGAQQAGLQTFHVKRPENDLLTLAQKLRQTPHSSLHQPSG